MQFTVRLQSRTRRQYELAHAGAYAALTHHVAALLAWNDVMAAILKMWRETENTSRSVECVLWLYLKNFPVNVMHISSRLDLKRPSPI